MADTRSTWSNFDSDSESDDEFVNADNKENGLNYISKISQNYNRAKDKNDLVSFGFEGVVENKNNKRKSKASTSTSTKESKSKSTKAAKRKSDHTRKTADVVPPKRAKADNQNKSAPGDNGDGENDDGSSLPWNARKNSKTKYLFDIFKAVSHPEPGDDKIDVICTLCAKDMSPLSITVGNNSNLIKHLKAVSVL